MQALTKEQTQAVRDYWHACDAVVQAKLKRAELWDKMLLTLTPEQAVEYTSLDRMGLLPDAVDM